MAETTESDSPPPSPSSSPPNSPPPPSPRPSSHPSATPTITPTNATEAATKAAREFDFPIERPGGGYIPRQRRSEAKQVIEATSFNLANGVGNAIRESTSTAQTGALASIFNFFSFWLSPIWRALTDIWNHKFYVGLGAVGAFIVCYLLYRYLLRKHVSDIKIHRSGQVLC